MKPVLLAHGLEGSPQGRKAQALRQAGLDPLVPNCQGLYLAQRIAIYEEVLQQTQGVVLVGSSYGGLASAWLATRGHSLAGLVLAAPALHHSEPPVHEPGAIVIPEGLPCAILHGVRDSVVPIAVSRALATRSPHVRLVEVDDDHSLAASTPLLVELVRELAG